ncbi:MAG: archease [Anaerolineales bacterium]
MSPYREVDHTADWALEVWAPTLEVLFVDAAHGMYALAGTAPGPNRLTRRVEVSGDDYESLLVAWLQELLYATESEGLVFSDFHIDTLTPTHLRVEASGGPGERLEKVIKAVTYHNLRIQQTANGYTATLVFDV